MTERAPEGYRPPRIRLDAQASQAQLAGQWVTEELAELEAELRGLSWPEQPSITFDAAGLSRMDTAGAWLLSGLLEEAVGRGMAVDLRGLREEHEGLLRLVSQRRAEFGEPQALRSPGWLESVGRTAWQHASQAVDLLAFVGETAVALGRSALRPSRIRWRAIMANVETAGVYALPISGTLAFLIGVVIAYQGGVQLKAYGANIFIVELVTLTVLRELAPMIVAVIVAGRTGSAYTAQIGTMMVTEEVDALRTIGIAPMDLLVLPKLLGLMIALPLLTVFADAMGVLGGMVMASVALGVSMGDFLGRVPDVVSVTTLAIGIGKTPVFAIIIATVGCYQGFQVKGGADSVGRQTTVSVVQAIFMVIIADALFSILFSWLGL
jgi:phospholipid/cholesterol/gamma-HCH transport system permease protein